MFLYLNIFDIPIIFFVSSFLKKKKKKIKAHFTFVEEVVRYETIEDR